MFPCRMTEDHRVLIGMGYHISTGRYSEAGSSDDREDQNNSLGGPRTLEYCNKDTLELDDTAIITHTCSLGMR